MTILGGTGEASDQKDGAQRFRRSTCRLSFVVTSRNDDFGGDMLRRLRIFSDGLLQLANMHRLSGELIIVEWNPTSGKRLSDVLQLHEKSDLFPIRFIEVPPAAHNALRNSDVLPLFQMIAKNVGIRRARGEFVCATNQDILFSEELFSFLASDKLQQNRMYRIDRSDVRAEVPEELSVTEQLRWCSRNLLRVHTRWGTKEKGARGLLKIRELMSEVSNLRWFFGEVLRSIGRRLNPEPKVHTNACGDFTLLAREHWLALRGYPELALYSLHIDSLLCYMAVASGLKEYILRPPARIFHLEHGSSWAVMSPEEKLRWFAVKPWIDCWLLIAAWQDMHRNSRPLVFNDENWGLGMDKLREVVLLSGECRAVETNETVVCS